MAENIKLTQYCPSAQSAAGAPRRSALMHNIRAIILQASGSSTTQKKHTDQSRRRLVGRLVNK